MGWIESDEWNGYFEKQKLGTQEIMIYAQCFKSGKINKYYIGAVVSTKRKKIEQHFVNNEVTGKSGIKTLIEIRKSILDLELFLKEKNKQNFEIIINWTDNRRRDVYIYGLNDYGYNLDVRNGKKCLLKKIAQN